MQGSWRGCGSAADDVLAVGPGEAKAGEAPLQGPALCWEALLLPGQPVSMGSSKGGARGTGHCTPQ